MARSDARTFRGRVEPGPAKVAVRALKEEEDYTIPGTGLKLWLPTPSSHEGFTGIVAVPTRPYFDQETGEKFDALYKEGDIVVVGKFTGVRITLNRDTYIICRERDIVCKIVPEEGEDLPQISQSVSQDSKGLAIDA